MSWQCVQKLVGENDNPCRGGWSPNLVEILKQWGCGAETLSRVVRTVVCWWGNGEIGEWLIDEVLA